MGDDPLDMASRTGRSCGTVGMDTGMMGFVWCPISGKENTYHGLTHPVVEHL